MSHESEQQPGKERELYSGGKSKPIPPLPSDSNVYTSRPPSLTNADEQKQSMPPASVSLARASAWTGVSPDGVPSRLTSHSRWRPFQWLLILIVGVILAFFGVLLIQGRPAQPTTTAFFQNHIPSDTSNAASTSVPLPAKTVATATASPTSITTNNMPTQPIVNYPTVTPWPSSTPWPTATPWPPTPTPTLVPGPNLVTIAPFPVGPCQAGKYAPIHIENTGDETANWTITNDVGDGTFLYFPASGSLASRQTQTITLDGTITTGNTHIGIDMTYANTTTYFWYSCQ